MFMFLKKCCPSDFEGVDRIAGTDDTLPSSSPQNQQNNQGINGNSRAGQQILDQGIQEPQYTSSSQNNIIKTEQQGSSSKSQNQSNNRMELQTSFKMFEKKQQQIIETNSLNKKCNRKIRHGYRVSDLEDLPKQEQDQILGKTDQLRKSNIGNGSSKVQIVWKKKSVLGCGAFSTVYAGWSITHNSPIAVKEIPCRNCGRSAQMSNSQRALIQSSENEVNALRNLQHQNIVKYMGCERDMSDEVVRVFMEYVGNYTLLDLVRKQGFLEEHSVSNYTVQILSGLSYLHSMFIIHRDIKGSNILWSERDDILKLADFGAATQLAQYLTTDSGSGELYGTPQYMSPEAMRGDRVSFASDIWAVGCVVLEMLTGKAPWQKCFSNRFIAVNILSQKQSGPPIPENISAQCKDFLSLCFRMNPRERPTAEQLLNHSFLSQQGTQIEILKSKEVEKDRSLSAPDIRKVSLDSEIVYRTTYSSIVINQILRCDADKQTQVKSIGDEGELNNSALQDQLMESIYTSVTNPIKSYSSDQFCDSIATHYTHIDTAQFKPQRYLQDIDSLEASIDSLSNLLHDEGGLLTKIEPDQRSSVGSKSEGSSMVLYGSVQCSPNVSPQISRANNKEKSTSLQNLAVNTSTDFSSAYSQIDENNNQGAKVAQLVQKMDEEARLPLTDAGQLLNQSNAKDKSKYRFLRNNYGARVTSEKLESK